MRLTIATCILLATLPAPASASVEESTVTWYDIELIVFRNLETRTTETWPPDAGVPAVEGVRALFPSPAVMTDEAQVAANVEQAETYPGAPVPYVPLEESAYQLNGVYASLQRSSLYEPVLHVAWTQPPLPREQSPHLRVTLPDALAPQEAEDLPNAVDTGEPLLGRAEENPSPESVPEFASPDDGPFIARPLDGVVQLSVAHYLHLDVDLVYLPDDLNTNVLDGDVQAATREWTEEERLEREQRRRAIMEALGRGDITLEEAEILALEPERAVFEGFRLDQFRRVRSRELNYFDHPAYGVIVMVTPREVSARTLTTDPGASR